MRNPRDFQEFAERLFPGQRIPKQRNPITIPKDVKAVLDEVSCATGIQEDWLARAARLVLDGLAGLQCLWFLHGLKGSINQAVKAPGDHEAQIKAAYKRYIGDPQKKKDQDLRFSEIVEVNWGEGYAVVEQGWSNKKPKKTQMKLGKLIHKLNDFMGKQDDIHGFFDEVLQDFEKRQVSGWDWIISAHPFDVLTMSHNRPWTSCMKPGGAYEFGPLTDLAAGSALFFFYRPGADKPCGRIVLRPAAFGDEAEIPVVIRGIRLYGSGIAPSDFSMGRVISEAAGYEVYVDTTDLCKTGSYGRALTRGVYDDTATAGCDQSDTEYDEAYSALSQAPWPESALDVGDIRDRAGVVKELVPRPTPSEMKGYPDVYTALQMVADADLLNLDAGGLLEYQNDWINNDSFSDRVLSRIFNIAGFDDEDNDISEDRLFVLRQEIWQLYSEQVYGAVPTDTSGVLLLFDDGYNLSNDLERALGMLPFAIDERSPFTYKSLVSVTKPASALVANELTKKALDWYYAVEREGSPEYVIVPTELYKGFLEKYKDEIDVIVPIPNGILQWDLIANYEK